MEPAISVPWAMAPIPAVTAAAAPPDEPPGVRRKSRGFRVSPYSRLEVNHRREHAGAFVRPMITAPAFNRLSTTGLLVLATRSRCNVTPSVVEQTARWTLTLSHPG